MAYKYIYILQRSTKRLSADVLFVRLQTDEDPPHGFSQVFVVKPIDAGYFIVHDIFRLSIHNTAWMSPSPS